MNRSIWDLLLPFAFGAVCLVLGRRSAARRGRSPDLWGVLAFLVPVALFVLFLLPKRAGDFPEHKITRAIETVIVAIMLMISGGVAVLLISDQLTITRSAVHNGLNPTPARQSQQPRTDASAASPITKQHTRVRSVDDFLNNQTTDHGEVAISGTVSCINNQCTLDPYKQSQQWVEIAGLSNLPETSRHRMLATCDAPTIGENEHAGGGHDRYLSCNAILQGTIIYNQGQVSITPRAITWTSAPEDVAAADPTLPPCDQVELSQVTKLVSGLNYFSDQHTKPINVRIETSIGASGSKYCSAAFNAKFSSMEWRMHYWFIRNQDNSITLDGSAWLDEMKDL